MASIARRIIAFLQSPRGRALTQRGMQELSKPSTQQALRRLAGRVTKGRRTGV